MPNGGRLLDVFIYYTIGDAFHMASWSVYKTIPTPLSISDSAVWSADRDRRANGDDEAANVLNSLKKHQIPTLQPIRFISNKNLKSHLPSLSRRPSLLVPRAPVRRGLRFETCTAWNIDEVVRHSLATHHSHSHSIPVDNQNSYMSHESYSLSESTPYMNQPIQIVSYNVERRHSSSPTKHQDRRVNYEFRSRYVEELCQSCRLSKTATDKKRRLCKKNLARPNCSIIDPGSDKNS